MHAPRVNVLGVGVSAVDMELALRIIDHWIAEGRRRFVTVMTVSGIMESRRDETFRRIQQRAGLVTPDGMPLVWLARWHGYRQVKRVYGPDLLLALCEHSRQKGYRHFFYGGGAGTAETLIAVLQKRFPWLKVAGFYAPPFRALAEAEDAAIVSRINDAAADIVWVGLGHPKQERWMAEHLDRIQAPVMIGVGAAFDFHAGLKKQAPLWMQRHGLERVFRLMTEPRRLWRRDLINNPLFVCLTISQLLGIKKFRLE